MSIPQERTAYCKTSLKRVRTVVSRFKEIEHSTGEGAWALKVRKVGGRQMYRLRSGDVAVQNFAVTCPWRRHVAVPLNNKTWNADISMQRSDSDVMHVGAVCDVPDWRDAR